MQKKAGRKRSKWEHATLKDVLDWRAMHVSEKAAADALGVSIGAFRKWTGAGTGKSPLPPSASKQLHIMNMLARRRASAAPKLAIPDDNQNSEKQRVARLLIKWAASEPNPIPFLRTASLLLTGSAFAGSPK